MSLSDQSKTICVVWDFPEIQTRFVTRDHALLNLPSGWTQFVGAISTPSSGAKFDLTKASLEVGDSEFSITDVDQLVTAWLSTNDANLSETLVIKRQGLFGEDEADYLVSRWQMEDYRIDMGFGGGYKFMLTNAFKAMSNALYEDFDSEAFELAGDFRDGDLTITLANVGTDSLFRVPGYLLIVDRRTKEQELIQYTQQNGRAFSGITRDYFGVGASNSTGKDFIIDQSEVFHVWVKRGSPVDVLMEWLTTTDATLESGGGEQLTNSDLDDWSGGEPDNWNTTGTVTEETTIVRSGSSAKLDGNSSSPTLSIEPASQPSLTPGKGYNVSVWVYVADAGNASETIRVRIRNEDGLKIWIEETQTWDTYDFQWSDEVTITRFGVWIKYHWSILTDSGFDPADDYSVNINLAQQSSAIAYVDDYSVIGPYDKQTNGPYDLGDGDGVGVKYTLINFNKVYEIRDTLWPVPTFDAATGNKETGTAVLFVETEPIDELKEFAELHLLLPFALKPLVNSKEQFVIDRYHDFFPTETTIGDNWVKKDFSAAKWKRNYSKVINNASMMTDYNVSRGKLIHSISVDSMESVSAYGRSKPLLLESRGGRSGRLSFPEYDSINDCEVAWGRIALELSNPWTQLEVKVFYEFRDLSQIDAVLMNIPNIPDLVNGVRGLTNQRFFVDSKKIDEKKGYIILTIRQRREPFRPALVAPNGLSDYNAESDANHIYAFVGADPPNPFSDGSEVYRVI